MEELFKQVLVILFAAAVGEAVIEFLLVPVVDLFVHKTETKVRTVIFNSLSGTLGVGIVFTFSLCLFKMLGAVSNFAGVDEVLTGIVIGRGSNFAHGLLKKYFLSITKELEAIEFFKRNNI